MSVRLSLLAILNQGACYGYQVRSEFDRRTSATWPVNVGQIYATLDRLDRDGLVTKSEHDDDGQTYFAITEAGSAEVDRWLGSPVERTMTTRDELAMKLSVAVTLPGVDIAEVIQVQRNATMQSLLELTRSKNLAGEDADTPQQLSWLLIVDSLIFTAEAEIRWLDHSEARLARAAAAGFSPAQPLSTEPARKGRPVGQAPATGANR